MCFPASPAPAQQIAPAAAPPAPAPLAQTVSPDFNANAAEALAGQNANGPKLLRDSSVGMPGGGAPGVQVQGGSGLVTM